MIQYLIYRPYIQVKILVKISLNLFLKLEIALIIHFLTAVILGH